LLPLHRLSGISRSAIVGIAPAQPRKADFSDFAGGRGGVRQAPMRGHRLPRPDRAHFRFGIVAKRKYEIEFRRFRARELRPVFAAQAGYVIVQLAQQIGVTGSRAASFMESVV
jgi:hypothetical protein